MIKSTKYIDSAVTTIYEIASFGNGAIILGTIIVPRDASGLWVLCPWLGKYTRFQSDCQARLTVLNRLWLKQTIGQPQVHWLEPSWLADIIFELQLWPLISLQPLDQNQFFVRGVGTYVDMGTCRTIFWDKATLW